MIGTFRSADEAIQATEFNYREYSSNLNSSKSRTRPNVSFSDIDFLEEYTGLPGPVFPSEIQRARRLIGLGLMEQDKDYLPREIYTITLRGRDFLKEWHQKREPLTRLRKMLSEIHF